MRPTRRLPEWMVVIAFALALLPGFVDVSGESAFAAQTGQEETPADAVPATADDESAVEPRADEVESANEAQPDLPPRPSLPQQDFEKSDRRAGEPEGPTDDDLIERIDPAARSPLDEARERLERAIESMRSAKDRLADDDTGSETRALQSRAVEDLEKLLEALQQPPAQSQQSQSQSQQQNQNRSQNQQRQQQQRQSRSQSQRQRQQSGRKRRPQSQRQQRGQQASQPQPTPGERAEQPTGAEERTDAARRKVEEEARRRSVAADVWGHLPPNVREALQKSFNERYLPKYEDLVRRYYESLAEQNRSRNGR